MPVRTVAMLTAGGLAPCLSSAVGGLIERYTQAAPDVRIIAYTNGYAGLLRGQFRGNSETKMIECLNRLGQDVEIVVRKAPRSHPKGHTQVVFV